MQFSITTHKTSKKLVRLFNSKSIYSNSLIWFKKIAFYNFFFETKSCFMCLHISFDMWFVCVCMRFVCVHTYIFTIHTYIHTCPCGVYQSRTWGVFFYDSPSHCLETGSLDELEVQGQLSCLTSKFSESAYLHPITLVLQVCATMLALCCSAEELDSGPQACRAGVPIHWAISTVLYSMKWYSFWYC